jgi:hypothetical protein
MRSTLTLGFEHLLSHLTHDEPSWASSCFSILAISSLGKNHISLRHHARHFPSILKLINTSNMTTNKTKPEFEVPLDIFGQDPTTAFATPFVFFWPLQGQQEISTFVARLQLGLDKLSNAVSWVAGKVVKRSAQPGDAYPYKIVPSGPTPKLIVRDYRAALDVPSMDELVEGRFPIRLLDENVLSPINVLPGRADEERSAVLTIQCNWLRGGLAVNIVGHHQVLDGTGQEQVVYLLDKACRGEAFDEEEIAAANLDRTTLLQPFDSYWQPPMDSTYIKPSPPTVVTEDPESRAPMPAVEWVNWAFPQSALATLKSTATQSSSGDYISTDDALTALIWQSLARARLHHLGPATKSTLARAVNPRRYVGIPLKYPGHVSNNAYSNLTLHELAASPLGTIASALRNAVDPRTSGLRETTREFATLLLRASDRSSVNMGARLDLECDLMVSSWAGMRCYQFDFGLGLGCPLAFRRPKQALVPSLVFLLPRRGDGEIVVKMGARADDLDALKGNREWTRFAEYLG